MSSARNMDEKAQDENKQERVLMLAAQIERRLEAMQRVSSLLFVPEKPVDSLRREASSPTCRKRRNSL